MTGYIITPMRRLWNLFLTLAAIAIFANVMFTVPQSPLKAQKGGADQKGGAALSASQAAGITSAQNLKVLTPQEAGMTMQYITLALGENCSFCHDMGNLALDTK